MADPTFYSDGYTPNSQSTPFQVLQKILGATIDLGGGGGGSTPVATTTVQGKMLIDVARANPIALTKPDPTGTLQLPIGVTLTLVSPDGTKSGQIGWSNGNMFTTNAN
jgi:hypothetical protein